MAKKTIFLGIAFGTSVRDVLRNDTFIRLKEDNNIRIIIFSTDVSETFTHEFKGDNVFFEKLNKFTPSLIERILLNLHKTLLREKCRTIDLGNTAGDTRLIDQLTPFMNLLKRAFGYKRVNQLIGFLYKYFTFPTLYRNEFAKYKPDLVVITRALNYSLDYPLLRRSISEKVPVIALVSSWDNFTSKAFFPFSLESIVVWNNVMREEAINLFAFPDEKVFVSGIPRYDLFFKEEGFSDRDTFFSKFNLDPAKKLIVYGTGSATTGCTALDLTSPEPEIVEYIADKIEAGAFAFPTQLLVRLHPQADPKAYSKLQHRKGIILHIPGDNSGYHDRLFKLSDDIGLGETMKYADVVVNLASTITIDAAVFDTPVICIGFDFRGERPFKWSVRRFYEFDHYAKLMRTGGFDLARDQDEMVNMINRAIAQPEYLRAERRAIVSQQCFNTDGQSGARIAAYIVQKLEST